MKKIVIYKYFVSDISTSPSNSITLCIVLYDDIDADGSLKKLANLPFLTLK